ncbi:MAG TPA: hypothetical protein VHX12_01925 [Acidisoma sp.]|nr:hypothetical protein [Acidisoma sp.]
MFGVLFLTLVPPVSGPVAFIFPPWWDASRAATAAATAGRLVRVGALPFIVVVLPDRQGPQGHWPRTGAWLALDPTQLGGCGVPSSSGE